MHKLGFVLTALILLSTSALTQSAPAGRFDGKWFTKFTC
jgi:hypothetical protein